MRTKKPSHKAFKEAFDSGQVIRLHLMRGTWQLVTAEGYWHFITLCAPKAIAVTKGWMHSNKISIPDEELYRVRDILAQTAADKGSATKEDFIRALAKKDISMDDGFKGRVGKIQKVSTLFLWNRSLRSLLSFVLLRFLS
jgi:hypothetical protein